MESFMDVRQTNTIVSGIDSVPNIMELRIGRWCAWPIVKRTIRLLLMERILNFEDIHQRSSLANIEGNKRKRYFYDVMSTIVQLAKHNRWRKHPQFIILNDTDSFREQDRKGRYFDVFFDDLLNGRGLTYRPYIIEDGMMWPHKDNVEGRRHLNAELLLLLSELLSHRPVIRRQVSSVAKPLSDIISKTGIPMPKSMVKKAVQKKLERFEGARICYKKFFKWRNIKALLLIDSNSRFGQIAAAKELNVPVIEFQHGIIGKDNVGYQWSPSLLPNKKNMALADNIFVFGQLWQEMLVKNGFWNKEEILSVGSALIDRYRYKHEIKKSDPYRLNILFTTDWTLQDKAILFWKKFMDIAESKKTSVKYKLFIKPHPCEDHYQERYRVLIDNISNKCVLMDRDESTYKAMISSDLHVSFASTTLLESAGLGIPTICISGNGTNGDLQGLIGSKKCNNYIVHIDSPEDLLGVLVKINESKDFYKNWRETTKKEGNKIFKKGFLKNSVNIINRELN
jgi:hypothetical protein